MFELLYPDRKFPTLNYNMQRILIECIAHDSELEADHEELAHLNAGQIKDKHTIVMKVGTRERQYMEEMQLYAQKSAANRELVFAPVTILTTKEYRELGESANYYRNLTEADQC